MILNIAVLMLSSSLIMILTYRKKKIKKIISLLLCVIIIGNYGNVFSIKANAIEVENFISINQIVICDNKELCLSANINYEIEQTYDEQYYSKLLGFDNNIDLIDENDDGVPDSIEDLISVDCDEDGLSDVFEKIYYTDPADEDTDKDLLPDGYEILILGTDARKKDSNDNGIDDTYEDPDIDKLFNIDELNLKTHPLLEDTDSDGLIDYEEIKIHNIDPLNNDTDEDGLWDGNEIKYNMKPSDPDTLNDNTLDGDRLFEISVDADTSDNSVVTPKLTVKISGKQIQTLSFEKVDNSDVFLNNTIPGYIGNAYDLNVEGNFDTALLSFELDQNLFDNNSFLPSIYYWDNEHQTLLELENQSITNNTISAVLNHFSNYIVLDKSKYMETVYEYEIVPPTDEELQNKAFDIYVTLDESGSINESDFSLMKDCCIELIDNLTEDDRVGVITFDETVRNILSLSNLEIAKQKINELYQHKGSTALYDAIDKSVNSLNSHTDSSNIVIALTDGLDNSSSISYEIVVDNAKKNNVILYTIGVGSNVNSDILTKIASESGGQYYSVSDFNGLSAIFERVIENADLYKDTDEDGISDYHEKCITNGKLKLGTGASVPNLNSLSYLNDDSDGDNMLDGEEIEIKEQIINGESVYYCYLYSNPCISDTDSDGLDDYIEWYGGLEPLLSGQVSDNNMSNTNTFEEWTEMVSEHSWNYIHNLVEQDIVNKHAPNVISEVWLKSTTAKNIKRIDLLHNITRGIWDVKPASYRLSPKREKGIEQLNDYISLANQVQNGLNVHIGGAEIASGYIDIADYNITYTNDMNGLITYYFEKKLKEPQKELAPEKIPVTEPSAVYEVNENWLWEVAKELEYDVQKFGECLLDFAADMSEWLCDHVEEIVQTGVSIGGILGIVYIIVNILPVLALA